MVIFNNQFVLHLSINFTEQHLVLYCSPARRTGGLLVGASPFPAAFCSARASSLCLFSCLVSGLYLWASLNICVAKEPRTLQINFDHPSFRVVLQYEWYLKLLHQWSWWKCQHRYLDSKYFTSFAKPQWYHQQPINHPWNILLCLVGSHTKKNKNKKNLDFLMTNVWNLPVWRSRAWVNWLIAGGTFRRL